MFDLEMVVLVCRETLKKDVFGIEYLYGRMYSLGPAGSISPPPHPVEHMFDPSVLTFSHKETWIRTHQTVTHCLQLCMLLSDQGLHKKYNICNGNITCVGVVVFAQTFCSH